MCVFQNAKAWLWERNYEKLKLQKFSIQGIGNVPPQSAWYHEQILNTIYAPRATNKNHTETNYIRLEIWKWLGLWWSHWVLPLVPAHLPSDPGWARSSTRITPRRGLPCLPGKVARWDPPCRGRRDKARLYIIRKVVTISVGRCFAWINLFNPHNNHKSKSGCTIFI